MKKSVLFTSMSIMVMAGAMAVSSCSKGSDVFDSNAVAANNHSTVVDKYEAAFKAKYGDVSGETWDYSIRGGAKAQTRKNDKNNGGDYLTDWRGTESYGYVWNYKEKANVSDPMPENEVNNLVHNYWDTTILPAINRAEAKPWNPSGKIVFRTLITTRDANTQNKYFAVGAEIAGTDLFLRMASPANGNNGKGGTTSDQHTSSIDFSQIPAQGVQWYACATTGQNQNKIEIDAADWKLQNFKEVTVMCKNKDNEDMECTFWCFQCYTGASTYTYTDIVLWVQKVPSVPVLSVLKRYMVEDVGESDDFDFNDIVFDVAQYSDGKQWCFVRALGGTLGITIKVGDKTWSKEPTFNIVDMLNTAASDVDYSKSLADFEVTGWSAGNNNVSVEVTGKDGFKWVLKFPETGEVPFIVATADGKEWMTERNSVPTKEWFGEPND